ncbi:hypothetical protein [Pseudomonas sp. DR48]|uniref:hypothetical protein n=1 Tax=Pseudomonas sp. DR48 TaxID=2871095 RepID=UPI0021BD6B13|nr:hypothetical protein [Pseudomonas sp. DR48]
MALPSLDNCSILATGGDLIDYGLLHHLVAVLGIELERLQVEHERVLRVGSELIDDLLQERLTERSAQERLEQLNFPLDQACLVLARPKTELAAQWPLQLRREGLEVLIRKQGGELILLLKDRADAQLLQHQLQCPLGVSNALLRGLRTVEALREARLALAHGPKSGRWFSMPRRKMSSHDCLARWMRRAGYTDACLAHSLTTTFNKADSSSTRYGFSWSRIGLGKSLPSA